MVAYEPNREEPIEIRDAIASDAQAASIVLRRSIIELCQADHRNDPAILTPWLSNKTPEGFAAWLAQPSQSLVVATDGQSILAVGAVTDTGQITLLYVSPDFRFRGVSRAMLVDLEARARASGNTHCHLTSTHTAHRFYKANGYADDTPSSRALPSRGIGMTKHLIVIL